jgi:Terminase large subunit, T4likevirus-type, N-terminal
MNSTKPAINIIAAITDPNILGDVISPAQEAALRAMYGLPMSAEHLELASQCAGKAWQAGIEYREAAIICGRRSGKSDKVAANIAIYEALFRQHHLSPGETGVVLLLAQNLRQAKVVKSYIEEKLRRSPILSRHVVAVRANEIEIDNGTVIAIHPASFRAVRGLSVAACICDEVAFWWTEEGSANPDVEVLRAVRPAMATFSSAKLVLISSPYAKSGALWDAWRKRDEDTEVLVWHAPTALMNPTVTKRFLQREQRRDPENYRREYLAEFTEAVGAFLSAESIARCVVKGRTELPPDTNHGPCVCTIDAAFKGDRFTLAIAHYDRKAEKVVVDVLRSWQGSSQEPLRLSDNVLPDIQSLAKRYGFGVVYGDQFGSQPLKELFERAGLYFEEKTFTNASKADIYAELRTRINETTIELLDHEKSLRELRGLQLQLLPGGSTRIGHASHGRAHDDFADAIALAVNECRELAYGFEGAILGATRESYDESLYR